MKLAIDAGHGWQNKAPGQFDPGAQAGGQREADIALAFALAVKAECVRRGLHYFLTRSSNQDSDPVATRARRAADAGCSHFLAIHANAGNPGASGVETYIRASDDRHLAQIAQAAAVKATGLHDRGIRPESETAVGRLAVLSFPGPAALVELGYIDATKDRAKLLSRAVRIAFAQLLVAGLLE